MALANYRIMSLFVEGFRGFTTPQSISFDGCDVFIFGENGLGKSSIIEAIQWCLFGGADIQVRNSVYEKQECRVALQLAGPKGKLSIRRELRPGRAESDLRIEDARGKEVTLREVFPQLAKLRSSERTQVIFAAQQAAGRRSRADITEFARVLYFYLKLEDVPDLIDEISDLIEEQRSESEKIAKRIEVIEDGYRSQRKRLLQLVEDMRANPPWEEGPSPSEAETDRRIAEFVEELAELLEELAPKDLSSDDLLQKAEMWLNLHSRDAATIQSKLRARSQQAHQLEGLVREAREAERLLSEAEQRHEELRERAHEMLADISRKALANEIARRERAQTKTAAELALAESVVNFCDTYDVEACPACGSTIDGDALREHANTQLEDGEAVEARSEKLKELRAKLRALDDATTAEVDAGENVVQVRRNLDNALVAAAASVGQNVKDASLGSMEAYLGKLRGDLAHSRAKTDATEVTTKQLQRHIGEYRRERQYHLYRREIAKLDRKLEVGMEEARKRFRDQQDFLHQVDQLKRFIEIAFKNAIDRAIPPLNNLLSAVYQRLTRQRSFELVRIYHDPARIGHLELRVAQKHKPDKSHPVNVLNGQALKALHLVPYLVFSRFHPEILELDLLLIDDPSESFDTSHVALLIQELSRASEHAQLIVASHEQEKFSPHLDDYFDRSKQTMMVVSDFDPVSGPHIDRC